LLGKSLRDVPLRFLFFGGLYGIGFRKGEASQKRIGLKYYSAYSVQQPNKVGARFYDTLTAVLRYVDSNYRKYRDVMLLSAMGRVIIYWLWRMKMDLQNGDRHFRI